MTLGLHCSTWYALFFLTVVAFGVGNALGFRVWKSRRPDQPFWRPFFGIGYLLRPEYYEEDSLRTTRKIAAALLVVGILLGCIVAGAVLHVVLSGGAVFCGLQL